MVCEQGVRYAVEGCYFSWILRNDYMSYSNLNYGTGRDQGKSFGIWYQMCIY
jgi:hypothetical protein